MKKAVLILITLFMLFGCTGNPISSKDDTREEKLSEERIKKIVFEDAGVLQKDVTDFSIKNNQDEIEVFFIVWPKEYTYILDSKTGDIWNLNIKVNH